MHHAFDMPFWAVVICTTVAARTLLLPLFVIMQRNAARMKIVAPLIEEEKAAFEMTSKTSVDQARQARNIQKIFQENKVNPLKSLAPAFGQTPIFISFFWAFTSLHERYPAYVILYLF
jgi:YidC/Oxa1 family membrane protein insertase